MPHVKTAISLEQALFEELDSLAAHLDLPRSRLVALALEQFLRRHENEQLLEQLNSVYQDAPDDSEQMLERAMVKQQRQIVE